MKLGREVWRQLEGNWVMKLLENDELVGSEDRSRFGSEKEIVRKGPRFECRI